PDRSTRCRWTRRHAVRERGFSHPRRARRSMPPLATPRRAVHRPVRPPATPAGTGRRPRARLRHHPLPHRLPALPALAPERTPAGDDTARPAGHRRPDPGLPALPRDAGHLDLRLTARPAGLVELAADDLPR